MTIDLEIALFDRPTQDRIDRFIGDRLDVVGSIDNGGGGVSIESKRWSFQIDELLRANREDLAPEFAARVVASNWLLQIHVPRAAPKVAEKEARALARHLAESCRGVVFDPQAGKAAFPRGANERAPSPRPRGRGRERLELYAEWVFVERSLSDALPDVLACLESVHPLLTPVRFGEYEPLQFRYDEDRPKLERIWRKASSGGLLLWTCAAPATHGSFSWPYPRPDAPDRRSLPASRLSAHVDGESIVGDDLRRTACERMFVRIARALRADFARLTLRGVHETERGVVTDHPKRLPASTLRNAWLGVPNHLAWMTWLGERLRNARREGLASEDVKDHPEGVLIIDRGQLEGTRRPAIESIDGACLRRQIGVDDGEAVVSEMTFEPAQRLVDG